MKTKNLFTVRIKPSACLSATKRRGFESIISKAMNKHGAEIANAVSEKEVNRILYGGPCK